MAISHWPAGDRPRERLLALGAQALGDAELLAIFLRTGCRGKSAVQLGRELLSRHGSLAALLSARPEAMRTPGIGNAKIALMQAAVELARRALKEDLATRNALNSPQAVRDYLRLALSGLEHEVFVVMMLDAQHRVIAFDQIPAAVKRGDLLVTCGLTRLEPFDDAEGFRRSIQTARLVTRRSPAWVHLVSRYAALRKRMGWRPNAG